MVTHRLAKLERAAAKVAGGWRCPTCGGTRGGVAQVPMLIFAWEPNTAFGPFGADMLCRICGSEPSEVLRITSPLTEAAALGEENR